MTHARTLLLTRPQTRQAGLSAALQALGFSVISAPLLEIEPKNTALPDLDDFDALVFTSPSGVECANLPEKALQKPVFAIGEATAAAARARGFSDITTGAGDGLALAGQIRQHRAKGRLLHLCGEHRTEKIDSLKNQGLTLQHHVVYCAQQVSDIPAAALRALRQNAIEAVLLFSVRSAENLAKILTDKELEPTTARALCLSGDIGNAARSLRWKSVEVAAQPNTQSLLNLLR